MDDEIVDDLSLGESIQLLIEQVPVPVKEFILNDLTGKTESYMTKYRLHVDLGGILQRELLLMLLGQETPDEFVKALQDAEIPQTTINSLVADINQEIFIRLRDEERLQGDATPPTKPISTPVPAQLPPTLIYNQPIPAPSATAPVMSVPPAYIPPVAPPPGPSISEFVEPFGRTPAPQVVAAPVTSMPPASFTISPTIPEPSWEAPTRSPVYEPPMPAVTKIPAPLPPPLTPVIPTGPMPGARTMKQDMQRAEEMHKSSQATSAQVTPNPYTYIPPTKERPPVAMKIQLPDDGVLSGQGVQTSLPKANTVITKEKNTQSPAPRTENQESLYSALKQYGIDPYREPAE